MLQRRRATVPQGYRCDMRGDGGPSRATAEGQMIAFVAGLTSLKGRRRVAARLAAGGVLLGGGTAVVFGAVKAFTGAFG